MDVIRAAVKLGVGAHKAVAITNGHKSHSYAQLLRFAWELSAKLHAETDQRNGTVHVRTKRLEADRESDGDRVGIMAVPCAEFMVGMWGTWLSGGVAVPLALSHPEAELMHVLTDANIKTIITTDDHKSLIQGASEKCAARLFILPSLPSLEEENQDERSKSFETVLEEMNELLDVGDEGKQAGLIIYTSGTTGKPKGAVHTQAGMDAQVAMLSSAWGYSSRDRFLHCLPLHHVHGLFNGLLAPLYAGASVHFLPKFSVRGVWECWRESYPVNGPQPKSPITCFTGVPTMYVRLLHVYESMSPELREASASAARQLRLMMCGSSALPLPVMTHWEKVTGHWLLERYGMTEFGMALSNPLEGERRPGTVGKPLPGIKMKVVQDENSQEANSGELCIQSPSMFREYWNQPAVTKDAFRSDGYFRTGDFVQIGNDGYVRILGRTSVDIIKSGGYKLSALEIESVLLENPKIAECAVLGIPDKDYGEVISAVVILNEAEGSKLTLEQFRGWALERMAPYKVPKRMHVWKTLPRNAMGKVNKKELKNLLMTVKAASVEHH